MGTSKELSGTIPTQFGLLLALTALHFDFNKLTGAIPGTLSRLTNLVDFTLHLNPGLCRLDLASTLVADKCHSVACPYPTCKPTCCGCYDTPICPTGAVPSNTTAVHNDPLITYYSGGEESCCPVGNTVLEHLVQLQNLDCTGGRPCVATTGISGRGTQMISLQRISINAEFTGTLPPEIGLLTKATYM